MQKLTLFKEDQSSIILLWLTSDDFALQGDNLPWKAYNYLNSFSAGSVFNYFPLVNASLFDPEKHQIILLWLTPENFPRQAETSCRKRL